MTDWLASLVSSSLLSILGGGLLGVWLTNRRLWPKTTAEARSITAAAAEKDWLRFEREINRLVKRLEEAEDRATRAEAATRECEKREASLRAEFLALKHYVDTEGQMRQEAAKVAAAERLREGRR